MNAVTIAWIFVLVLTISSFSDVSVSNVFSDHLVLQQKMIVPIWGKGSPGEAVLVSIADQNKTTITNSDGTWRVELDSMDAACSLTLSIKGNNTINISDVCIGEVWQIAGQSNMDTRLSFYPELSDSLKNADEPLLRFITLRQPGQTTGGQNPWLVVSPQTAGDLSATGYFFGKEIQKYQNVAVGLVVTAVGGTTITQWMDPKTLSENPNINNSDRGDMWNTWVSPVAGYGIKGTCWIQGEQNCNATDAPLYGDRFELLIKGWRDAWGQGNFPFIFGQLSSTSGTATPDNISYVAEVREGQRMGLFLPFTAMSVNFDIGIGNWHYPNKPEAGRRLSLPARSLVYGDSDLVYSGPIYASHIIDGNKIKLLFNHIGSGLTSNGQELTGFAIAGESNNWVWAEAQIKGDTVIASSPSLANPVKVRYAWSDRPSASLWNEEGLPASPFTTESPEFPLLVKRTFSSPRYYLNDRELLGQRDILGRLNLSRQSKRLLLFK